MNWILNPKEKVMASIPTVSTNIFGIVLEILVRNVEIYVLTLNNWVNITCFANI